MSITAAPIAVEVLNGSSVVNDSDLDTVEEVNAVLQVRFTGLKAEAAVLNGVALTAAQVTDLVVNTSITFNEGTDDEVTYENAADGDFAGVGLLSRVITGAPAPVLAVHEDYANGTSADFAATVTFGEGALNSNYSLSDSDNTAGIFSVGKGTPTIDWVPTVDSIVYGTAIGADQLNATVTDVSLLDAEVIPKEHSPTLMVVQLQLVRFSTLEHILFMWLIHQMQKMNQHTSVVQRLLTSQ